MRTTPVLYLWGLHPLLADAEWFFLSECSKGMEKIGSSRSNAAVTIVLPECRQESRRPGCSTHMQRHPGFLRHTASLRPASQDMPRLLFGEEPLLLE